MASFTVDPIFPTYFFMLEYFCLSDAEAAWGGGLTSVIDIIFVCLNMCHLFIVAFWTEKCLLVTLGPSGLWIAATGTKWRWIEIQSQLHPNLLTHVAFASLECLIAER